MQRSRGRALPRREPRADARFRVFAGSHPTARTRNALGLAPGFPVQRVSPRDLIGGPRALVRHAARQFLAGLHAAAAAFGADATMLMHGCVPLALLGAQPAGGGADAE